MKATIIDTHELPAILTMRQIQQLLGVSKTMAYDLSHRAGFPSLRFGRTIRVPREALLKWLETQAGGGE